MRRENVGLRLGEHVEEVMVLDWNLVVQVGVGGSRSLEGGYSKRWGWGWGWEWLQDWRWKVDWSWS